MESSDYPQYLGAELDKFCESLLEESKVPGASLAVVDGDSIYTKAYGVTRPNGPKVTEDTLFNVASMSKSFTSSAVALLVDDDEKYPHIKWNTPVSELMREDFVLSDPYYTQNITVTDILSHRTGYADHEDVSLGVDAKVPGTPQSITRHLRDLPVATPLRTKFAYNNLMFTAAAYLVELATGQTFAEVLKSRFFDPLGMDRTYVGVSRIPESDLKDPANKINAAVCCYWDKETKQYTELPDTLALEGQGAGNIMSTAKDWAKWIHANIHGTHGVSKESLLEMTRPIIQAHNEEKFLAPFESPSFYGMGWFCQWYRGHKIITHSGGVPGFGSWQCWLPQKKWGAAIFGNSSGIDLLTTPIIMSLLDEKLGVPKEERTDWVKWEQEKERMYDAEDEESAKIFPDRADPPLAMPLPLSAYAGHYKHPAYHELTLHVTSDDNLFADASDRTFGFTLTFEHVSSNYFVARKELKPKSADNPSMLESEFHVGVSGKVERLGIAFTGEAGGERVWFDRMKD